MFCPYCGKENANAFGYCNSCGKPMVPVAGVSPGAAPAPGVYPSPPQKAMNSLGWIAILSVAAFAVFIAITWPVAAGEDSVKAYKTGIFIGLLLPPLIVAYLAGGIKKWRSPNRFALVFLFVGAVWASLAWMGSKIEKPDDRIARLLREASGQQPIKKDFLASEQNFDNVVREQFRRIIELNREYSERFSKFDNAELSKVATPESFVDLSYAEKGLEELHERYMVELQLTEKLTEIGDHLRQAVDVTDWPPRRKAQFLQGFDSNVAASVQRRRGLIDAEEAYVEATDNLYDYVKAQPRGFRMIDGRLTIVDNSLRAEFNSKMRTYNARRSDLIRVRDEFKSSQSSTLSKFGLTSKDLGLQ